MTPDRLHSTLPLRGKWLDLFLAVFLPPLLTAAIIAVCVGLAFGLDVPGHNLRLGRLERRVERDLIHPPGSKLILRRAIVENLNGTGNGCTFAVVELRSGGGSVAALADRYRRQSLKDPDTGELLRPEIWPNPATTATEIGNPVRRLTSPKERKAADYAVTVTSWSEPGCDYRCE